MKQAAGLQGGLWFAHVVGCQLRAPAVQNVQRHMCCPDEGYRLNDNPVLLFMKFMKVCA